MLGSNQQKRPLDFTGGQPQWGGGMVMDDGMGGAGRKKRRSRWANDECVDKTVIPGMPTIIPANLSKEQERQYLLHLQIEEISRRLRTGDLGIPPNPEDRSPSPEPIYNNEGKRLNTREYRTRKKLEEDRHKLVQEALNLNQEYKPPADYKPPVIRVNDKVMIPQEEHPDINFVGLLIGPRGNTLKTLEKETGAKIIIRGKGSVKDGKIGRKDGQPLPGEDEPLHAYVTANNPENVRKAVEKIKAIIKESVEVPEGQNDLRKQQLRELALLNGTLRENDGLAKLKQIQQAQTIVTNTIICTNCGGTGHLGKDCKQQRPGDTYRMMQAEAPPDKAKMDSEYMSLMAELGEGPPPKQNNSMMPHHHHHHHHQHRPHFPPHQPPHQSRFNQPPPNPMGGFNFPGNNTNRPAPHSMMSMNNRPPMNNPGGPPPPMQNPNQHPPPQQQQQQQQQQPPPQQMFQGPPPIPQQGMPGMHNPNQMQHPPHMQQQQHPQQPPQQQQQQQQQQPGAMPPFLGMPQQPQQPVSAPQPVAPPPATITSQFQPNIQMSVPAPVAPVAPVPPPQSQYSSMAAAPVPPPVWSNAPAVSQMSQTNLTQSQPPSVAVPPPPSSLMTAPPPPPPTSQTPSTMNNMPWLQQGSVPPPPPSSQGTWQQQTAPPPPPASMSQVPWQQVPPPPLSMPSSVAPPPPPPSSAQNFNMPPRPPTSYDPNQMSGVNQLLVAPPPPPPN